MYATIVLGGSLLLEWLVLELLLLLLLPLWLEVVAYFTNAVSAGKLPLRSKLSMRAPARIKDAKLVMGWMLNKAAVAGCVPRIIISIDSSSEGLSLT